MISESTIDKAVTKEIIYASQTKALKTFAKKNQPPTKSKLLISITFYFFTLFIDFFKDSPILPFSLSILGFALVFIGSWWQKNEEKISQAILKRLSKKLSQLLGDNHQC